MPTNGRQAHDIEPRALRTMFLLTSMPIGGQETLLFDLVRNFDRQRILPEICCLKERGPLGTIVANDIPVHDRLLRHKWDVGVLARLQRLFQCRAVDAVVTVGCGDKMFWGRLAAWHAQVPVIVSALHSTGWPDRVGWLNRRLTMLTDAFVGVARSHGEYLIRQERFPRRKVVVIPNGIDTSRFAPSEEHRARLRDAWNVPGTAPVGIIVAALRPEKNHARFLRIASQVAVQRPDTRFVIVGDGPERTALEGMAHSLRLAHRVLFLGTRMDIPAVMAAADFFLLTSDIEASPVTLLEAMACQLPVVASRVGSIPELVAEGETGYLVEPSNEGTFVKRVIGLIDDPGRTRWMGQAGRSFVVRAGSREAMVTGYTNLLERVYWSKRGPAAARQQDLRRPLPACTRASVGRVPVRDCD